MKKYFGIGLSAAVILGVLASFYIASGLPGDPVVRIGYLNVIESLPLFIAEEKGFFSSEGIQIETKWMTTSDQLVNGVLGGDLDFLVESPAVPVLSAEIQSPGMLKVFSVSEITQDAPFDSILVREDSWRSNISDVAYSRIGVSTDPTAEKLLKNYLRTQDIDVSYIIFVPMSSSNYFTALMSGSVDAIHAYEPATTILTTGHFAKKIHGSIYAEILSPNPQGVGAMSESFRSAYPELARRVVVALEKAMDFMKTNDGEAREILTKMLNLSEEAGRQCVLLYMLPHENIDAGVFQEYADMLTVLEEIPGEVRVENILYEVFE
jgi:NitT/TauT family transport system substrate-binding protein